MKILTERFRKKTAHCWLLEWGGVEGTGEQGDTDFQFKINKSWNVMHSIGNIVNKIVIIYGDRW